VKAVDDKELPMRSEEIGNLLPGVFQRTLHEGNPLAAFLAVMEQMHAPAESAIADFDRFMDPRRAPEAFVPMLACWLDLDRLFESGTRGRELAPKQLLPTGLGRLRELVALAAHLSQWRGTGQGLLLFLRTATGLDGFEVVEEVPGEDGKPRPFHLLVRAPAAAKPLRGLLHRVIASEKPAYVTYDVQFTA
jgi:phage tail-like protein